VSSVPLVSALMVVREAGRAASAAQSIGSFLAQTWPHRQMLVANLSGVELPSSRMVTELRLRPDAATDPVAVLQDMVQGEWWFNWCDDGWFAPDYIQRHMQFADRGRVNVTVGAHGVLLPSGRRFQLTVADACLFSVFRDGRRLTHLEGAACAAQLVNRRPVDALALKFYRETL